MSQRSVEPATVVELDVEMLGVETETVDLLDHFRGQSRRGLVAIGAHGLGPSLVDGVVETEPSAIRQREYRL